MASKRQPRPARLPLPSAPGRVAELRACRPVDGVRAERVLAYGREADWAPQRTKSASNDQSGTPHLAILATPSGGAV